jgi:hypothetical protein
MGRCCYREGCYREGCYREGEAPAEPEPGLPTTSSRHYLIVSLSPGGRGSCRAGAWITGSSGECCTNRKHRHA